MDVVKKLQEYDFTQPLTPELQQIFQLRSEVEKDFVDIKEKRDFSSYSRRDDNVTERLKVKEEVTAARISYLKRHGE